MQGSKFEAELSLRQRAILKDLYFQSYWWWLDCFLLKVKTGYDTVSVVESLSNKAQLFESKWQPFYLSKLFLSNILTWLIWRGNGTVSVLDWKALLWPLCRFCISCWTVLWIFLNCRGLKIHHILLDVTATSYFLSQKVSDSSRICYYFGKIVQNPSCWWQKKLDTEKVGSGFNSDFVTNGLNLVKKLFSSWCW